VIATWWETAEWVNKMSTRAGKKIYFVQHHEIQEYLSPMRTRATYRMPMHKIVVAQWLADVMRNEYDDHDVDVVRNAVDHRQFFASERSKQIRPTVGLMYSVTRWKRFPLALQALEDVRSRLPELHVICFGMDYPPEPLPGFVSFSYRPSQESLRAAYSSCDVWLTASTSEGFNLPAMEAMACRTPVVSTRTGWPAEAVVDGVNGACVPVDDVAALAEATERLLLLPDAQWRTMSAQALETVRECSWERSTDLFEAALNRRL
jgi:glycosyltransferase involved in cell wall biosynthesis